MKKQKSVHIKQQLEFKEYTVYLKKNYSKRLSFHYFLT